MNEEQILNLLTKVEVFKKPKPWYLDWGSFPVFVVYYISPKGKIFKIENKYFTKITINTDSKFNSEDEAILAIREEWNKKFLVKVKKRGEEVKFI